MRMTILTICPEIFRTFLRSAAIKSSIAKKHLEIQIIDIRDFADGCFRKVDDSPYGGGPGLVLRCQPILDALRTVRRQNSIVIAITPEGKLFTQAMAKTLALKNDLIFICGHYEGFDARIFQLIDDSISIGDYVLTGGEIPAEVICDAIIASL